MAPRLTRRALVGGLAALAAACRPRRPEGNAVAATTEATAPPGATAQASASPPAGTAQASASPPAAAPRPGPPAPAAVSVRTVAFGPSEGGPQQAVIVTPSGGPADARYPLLIALGGLGETRRGLAAGAAGWVKDYW